MFLNSFGVKELYNTSRFGSIRPIGSVAGRFSGWEYYSNAWSRQVRSEFEFDDNFKYLGDTMMHYPTTIGVHGIILGNGIVKLGTKDEDNYYSEIKLQIYDDSNLDAGINNALEYIRGNRWTSNIEFTFYFNIKNYSNIYSKKSKGFIEITLGSDHHFADKYPEAKNCPYNSHDYRLRIGYDGRMYFTGEPYHTVYRDPKPDNQENIDLWDTNFQGLPTDTDIGIKFIKRVSAKTNEIFLECYRDMTNGFEGGTWIKLFEFLHTRNNWSTNTGNIDDSHSVSLSNSSYCVVPPPAFADDPNTEYGGGLCQILLTPIREIDIKWLSCRDIEPTLYLETANTTTTMLSETTASGDGDTDSY